MFLVCKYVNSLCLNEIQLQGSSSIRDFAIVHDTFILYNVSMRQANKQKEIPCKHLVYRYKTWTNPRPTFKVLAGNLLS